MVDWPGLLKWSLSISDGTIENKELQEMSQEDKKWLNEVMEHYTFDQAKEIINIGNKLGDLVEGEEGAPEEEQDKLILLDELEDLLDSAYATEISIVSNLECLIWLILKSKYGSIKMRAAQVLGLTVQNNPKAQQWAIDKGAFLLINQIKKEEMKVQEGCITAISALVRGPSQQIKTKFMSEGGFALLVDCLANDQSSIRLKTKIVFLLLDLIGYSFDQMEFDIMFNLVNDNILHLLISLLNIGDINARSLRENILECCRIIKKYKPELLHPFKEQFLEHAQRISVLMKENKELYEEEFSRTIELIKNI